jgi:hypothetical protein
MMTLEAFQGMSPLPYILSSSLNQIITGEKQKLLQKLKNIKKQCFF